MFAMLGNVRQIPAAKPEDNNTNFAGPPKSDVRSLGEPRSFALHLLECGSGESVCQHLVPKFSEPFLAYIGSDQKTALWHTTNAIHSRMLRSKAVIDISTVDGFSVFLQCGGRFHDSFDFFCNNSAVFSKEHRTQAMQSDLGRSISLVQY